jgi:hypothetical protein
MHEYQCLKQTATVNDNDKEENGADMARTHPGDGAQICHVRQNDPVWLGKVDEAYLVECKVVHNDERAKGTT